MKLLFEQHRLLWNIAFLFALGAVPVVSAQTCASYRGKKCTQNGCVWLGGGGGCVDPPTTVPTPPTPAPVPPPTQPPVPTTQPIQEPTTTTFFPGDLTVLASDRNGRRVRMSTGMEGRPVAYYRSPVEWTNGTSGQSSDTFHRYPDAAGCFPSPSGGFYYASNSEDSKGGVGVIEFDADGEVIGYKKTLTRSKWNCGGGKTPWGSWVSCEENGSAGRVWQTDPSGIISSRRTAVVEAGGNYESFAYDDREPVPRFFTTEDSSDGALVRYTPGSAGLACYNSATPEEKWCTLEDTGGTYEYLRIDPGTTGTFSWTTRASATPGRYRYSEGIDVVDGSLFFVSKVDKYLFELDLDAGTFVRTSTVSGAFNLQPDQLKAIDPDHGFIFFCEDGGSDCDLHGRNTNTGEYFTLVEGTGYSTETTGLAFCGNDKYMLLSFQGPGVIWQFWRSDGLAFDGSYVDIKYHSTSRRLRVENPQIRKALHDVDPFDKEIAV